MFRSRLQANSQISDHQRSWGYVDGPWKGPARHLCWTPLIFISIRKPPASNRFAPIKHALAVTVEPFKFSPASPVAYELSEFASLIIGIIVGIPIHLIMLWGVHEIHC